MKSTTRANRLIEQTPSSYQQGCRPARNKHKHRPQAFTLRAIVNRENLVRVFKERRHRSGQGAGIDGFSFGRFSITEFGDAAEVAVEAIYDRRWRPRRSRVQMIAKDPGGQRRIDIRCLLDKLISSAVAEETIARIDPLLLPGCYGFRPGRCVHGLLAEIAYRAETEGMTVIAQDDVKNAFPSAQIAHAVENYSRHVIDPGLLHLIEVILRGHDQSRQVGIDQGDPLSPPTLNQRLHYCLDLPTSRSTDSDTTRRYRYVDNLVYQCRSVSEGLRALQQDRALLDQNGFVLKGEKSYPVDLRRQGASIEMLGFVLRWREGQIKFGLGKKAYRKLATALKRAHEVPESGAVAVQVIQGWIEAQGPIFESDGVSKILNRVLRETAEAGFREIGSRMQLENVVGNALRHWQEAKERLLQDLRRRGLQESVLLGAPLPSTRP